MLVLQNYKVIGFPVYGISKEYTWIRQNGKKFMRKSGFKFIHFGLGCGGGVEGTNWLPPP
jgi:hypothetical protein